jgi:hypothetical protein
MKRLKGIAKDCWHDNTIEYVGLFLATLAGLLWLAFSAIRVDWREVFQRLFPG